MPTQTGNKPPNQSRSFLIAFERCMEQRPSPDGKFEMPIVPAVVCLAFSIELGLKALAEAEGDAPRGHVLSELFQKLSPGLQQSIVGGTGFVRPTFDALLAAASGTFVDWRYVHEQSNPTVNLEFLRAFAHAIQKARS